MKKIDLRKVDERVIELLRREEQELKEWSTTVVGLFGILVLLATAIAALVSSALSIA